MIKLLQALHTLIISSEEQSHTLCYSSQLQVPSNFFPNRWANFATHWYPYYFQQKQQLPPQLQLYFAFLRFRLFLSPLSLLRQRPNRIHIYDIYMWIYVVYTRYYPEWKRTLNII